MKIIPDEDSKRKMLEFSCGLYQCLLRFIYRPHLKCSLWNDAHITDYSEVVDQVVLTVSNVESC